MTNSRQDLTGKRFGKLTVLSLRSIKSCASQWMCLCECGNTTIGTTGHLNAGNKISCGCRLNGEHNITHGMSGTPEYRAWENARDRCRNPKNRKYPLYGGRGIRMCDAWIGSFENFISDMGCKPDASFTLDRINGDGDYTAKNCRWATPITQNNNRSINRHVSVNGARLTIAEASRATGIHHATISSRLNRGWSDERATAHV